MRPLDPPRSPPKPPLKTRKPIAGPGAAGSDTFASRLEEVEKAVERVRALHEAYFLGMERRAPEQERVDLQRRLNDLRRQTTSNTALKFRLETLVQRHIVLSAYWGRTLREIEAGTYRRDIIKAQRHQAQRTAATRDTSAAPAPAAGAPLPSPPAAASARTATTPPQRRGPPPIPAAAVKRAAALAIMSKGAPAPSGTSPPAPTPPPSPAKR